MSASSVRVSSGAVVDGRVKVIPAKRTAVYDVPLSDDRRDNLVAKVNAKDVVILGGIGQYVADKPKLPKTLAAVDAALALLEAVRAELVEQGITE